MSSVDVEHLAGVGVGAHDDILLGVTHGGGVHC